MGLNLCSHLIYFKAFVWKKGYSRYTLSGIIVYYVPLYNGYSEYKVPDYEVNDLSVTYSEENQWTKYAPYIRHGNESSSLSSTFARFFWKNTYSKYAFPGIIEYNVPLYNGYGILRTVSVPYRENRSKTRIGTIQKVRSLWGGGGGGSILLF